MGDSAAPGFDDERFILLLDTLPHMAFAISADRQAEHYNKAFVDYVGGVPGPGQDARSSLHHPDDRPKLDAARSAARAGTGEYVVEARMRRRDGVYRWHRIHNKPLVRAGKPVGYIGTAVDIHDVHQANEALEQRVSERTAALRESEARYRMLYHRTPMALHSVDGQALLIDVNDTWTELFGWSREEVIGRSPAEFMTADSAERYRRQAWPEMLSSVGQTRVVEYQFVTQEGRVFDGRLSSRGEFDGDGRFIRSWTAIADITGEKQAERDLMQAQRMEAVGQLTAGIAHDFNNLLTAVLGSLELLARRAGPDARTARLIGAAQSAAERGARLTAQLLAFSRQQAVAPAPVDLNRLVEDMRPLLQSTIGATVGIQLRLQPGLGMARADPTQLELAVLNLAINSRDAMMERGGGLTIATSAAFRDPPTRPEEPDAGAYICLSVADTGPGIAPSVRDRIFEPFFTTKDVGKGSGLGLSQVLGLLKQLEGGIAVRSSPGEGTCFELFLPAARTPESAQDAEGHGVVAAQPSRALAIMVVDDDAQVRRVTAEMLRVAGHEVLELASGAEALGHLQRARPDLMLADIAMPGMSGVELATAARRHWPGMPVLFMTGYTEERLLPAGGADVLRKPFGAAELAARIATAAG
jgi:PAS domain S-box-containing protein